MSWRVSPWIYPYGTVCESLTLLPSWSSSQHNVLFVVLLQHAAQCLTYRLGVQKLFLKWMDEWTISSQIFPLLLKHKTVRLCSQLIWKCLFFSFLLHLGWENPSFQQSLTTCPQGKSMAVLPESLGSSSWCNLSSFNESKDRNPKLA